MGSVLLYTLYSMWLSYFVVYDHQLDRLASCILAPTRPGRFYHLHYRVMENVSNTTLSDLLGRVTTATDVPLSVFQVPFHVDDSVPSALRGRVLSGDCKYRCFHPKGFVLLCTPCTVTICWCSRCLFFGFIYLFRFTPTFPIPE